MKTLFQVLNIFICTVCLAMNFKPPSSEEILQAIGSTEGLPAHMRGALEPEDDFEPIPVPNSGDWLAEHLEAGQTFGNFVSSKPYKPTKLQDTIYFDQGLEYKFIV
jgi:hypothetical protein